MNNYNKQIQKYCQIGVKSKKINRGKYNKIPYGLKIEILSLLTSSIMNLDQVSNFFKVNKETIRSHHKNQKKQLLYSELECYLVSKYLNEHQEESEYELEKISKYIKQLIDNPINDYKLQEILKDIQIKRQESKTKKKNQPIQFTSKNRRILLKIINYIYLAEAAAKKHTVSIPIKEKLQKDFYEHFIYQLVSYDPEFMAQINNNSESNSQYDTDLVDTKQYFLQRN